ncbi:MAG: TIGR04222 domain-containing membrane protein, partial [Novosphingobium sp.]
MTGLGPFDLHGSEFLPLYSLLAVVAGVACLVIPSFLRPDGRANGLRDRPADEDELALLTGGRGRFAEAVAVRLLAGGAATIEAGAALRIRDLRGGKTLAERRIIALPSPVPWKDVMTALAGPAETGERRLEEKGLLMDAGTALQLRLWQAAPLALLFVFGAIKWVVGAWRDRPVGNLTVLLVLTGLAALLRYALYDRRTRAGKQAVASARADAARLRRAMPTDEAPLAVALFGT